MKYVFLLLLIAPMCSYSQLLERSPQQIIDEVNASIDDLNCVSGLTSSAVEQLNERLVEDVNEKIKNILDQYNLSCLESMLDSGFLGLFNIDFNIPNFCELVADNIGKNEFFEKNSNGKKFKDSILSNVKEKQDFKKTVIERW